MCGGGGGKKYPEVYLFIIASQPVLTGYWKTLQVKFLKFWLLLNGLYILARKPSRQAGECIGGQRGGVLMLAQWPVLSKLPLLSQPWGEHPVGCWWWNQLDVLLYIAWDRKLPKIIFESLPFSPSPNFPDGNDSRGRLMAASYRQREEEAIEREMGILPREKVEIFVRCFRHI